MTHILQGGFYRRIFAGIAAGGLLLSSCMFPVGPGQPGQPGFQTLAGPGQQQAARQGKDPDAITLQINPGLFDKRHANAPVVTLQQATPASGFGIQSSGSDFDTLEQTVLAKADQLVAAGQGHCVYLPPSQPQNGNCNSSSTGFQCSGALDKSIQLAQCPEIAIYGGASNINAAAVGEL